MAETKSRTSRWLRIALVVSLALNLAVIGLVAGSIAKDPSRLRDRDRSEHGQRLPAGLRELGPLPFIVALEPDQRAALLDSARSRETDLRAPRSVLRQRFEEMLNLLRAEEFDEDALRALIAEQRSASIRRAEVGESLLVAQFAAMSQAERAAYADRLDRSLKRNPSRR